MKLLLTGLWVVLVALGAAYGGALYFSPNSGSASANAASAAPVIQTQKTRVINVPVVIDGVLRGYVAAQFVFMQDSNLGKTLQVSPDIYLLDEAFRAIYSDTSLDPRHVEKYDLKALTARLVQATNARLGVPLIKDVLIDNFSYIDKDSGKS